MRADTLVRPANDTVVSAQLPSRANLQRMADKSAAPHVNNPWREVSLRYSCLIFLVISALPLAAQKRPFTFEDMMKLKRVEEPVLSPDGRWVLFAAVDVDLVANTKTPHVWIVPTAGGPERKSSAIRTPTVHGGHRTVSASPSSRPGRADRRFGSQTSTVARAR